MALDTHELCGLFPLGRKRSVMAKRRSTPLVFTVVRE